MQQQPTTQQPLNKPTGNLALGAVTGAGGLLTFGQEGVDFVHYVWQVNNWLPPSDGAAKIFAFFILMSAFGVFGIFMSLINSVKAIVSNWGAKHTKEKNVPSPQIKIPPKE